MKANHKNQTSETAKRGHFGSSAVLGGFTLLPPKPDVCQSCAVKHAPEMPHNQQSLYWQYYFYGKHGRWPTWSDAMAHCTPEIQQHWIGELAKHGITVNPPNDPKLSHADGRVTP